jgi:hypothetical protein
MIRRGAVDGLRYRHAGQRPLNAALRFSM